MSADKVDCWDAIATVRLAVLDARADDALRGLVEVSGMIFDLEAEVERLQGLVDYAASYLELRVEEPGAGPFAKHLRRRARLDREPEGDGR